MKSTSVLLERTIFAGLVWLLTLGAVYAQTSSIPATYRTVSWADEESKTEVYLVQKPSGTGNFSLLVISEKEFKIFYRTEINSSQTVVQELVPVKTAGDRRYYEVNHHFSRTTIWMALEFRLAGKRVESLIRTFYGDIFEVVPNDRFWDRFPKIQGGKTNVFAQRSVNLARHHGR